MLRKGGVFDMIRQKMWWFGRRSGEPEAGQPTWYQHDRARPHTAKSNEKNWARHGAQKGFDIRVVTQPAQSPDLNANDLAFFCEFTKRHRTCGQGKCVRPVKSGNHVLARVPSRTHERSLAVSLRLFQGHSRGEGWKRLQPSHRQQACPSPLFLFW